MQAETIFVQPFVGPTAARAVGAGSIDLPNAGKFMPSNGARSARRYASIIPLSITHRNES
jgi:hypothetical protein